MTTTTPALLLGVDGMEDGRLAFRRFLATDGRLVIGGVDRRPGDTDTRNCEDGFEDALGAACEYLQRVLDQELTDRGVVGNSESHSPETASYIASYLLAGLDAFVDWFGTLSTISHVPPARVKPSTQVRFQLR